MKEKKTDPKQKVIHRIARMEGQLRGIRKMIKNEIECVDIIAQIMAVRQAASMLAVELLKNDFICRKTGKKEISEKYLKTLFKTK